MANKKNWFESIENRVPSTAKFEMALPKINGKSLHDIFFKEPFTFDNVSLSVAPFDEFEREFENFGFQEKDDHYEMVTNLGGQKGDGETPEDAVKIELTGKNNRIVEITYEHSTSTDENCFYSHSQKTSVTLPADADENTVRAYFDDDDNVVVSVKKKAKEGDGKTSRFIPIGRADRD